MSLSKSRWWQHRRRYGDGRRRARSGTPRPLAWRRRDQRWQGWLRTKGASIARCWSPMPSQARDRRRRHLALVLCQQAALPTSTTSSPGLRPRAVHDPLDARARRNPLHLQASAGLSLADRRSRSRPQSLGPCQALGHLGVAGQAPELALHVVLRDQVADRTTHGRGLSERRLRSAPRARRPELAAEYRDRPAQQRTSLQVQEPPSTSTRVREGTAGRRAGRAQSVRSPQPRPRPASLILHRPGVHLHTPPSARSRIGHGAAGDRVGRAERIPGPGQGRRMEAKCLKMAAGTRGCCSKPRPGTQSWTQVSARIVFLICLERRPADPRTTETIDRRRGRC